MSCEELLTNADEAGVFLCPKDPRPLLQAAERAGLRHWSVNLQGVADKPALMMRLAQALSFPGDFGYNWDALYDTLSERLLDEPAGVLLTLLECGDLMQADGEDFERLMEVLDAVVEDGLTEDIGFWVCVDGVTAADCALPTLDIT